MALIKKIDVDNYFAAKRATRLGRNWPVSKPAAAVTEPTGKPAKAKRSMGIRIPKNSSPSIPATVIPIAPSSGVRWNRTSPGSRQE